MLIQQKEIDRQGIFFVTDGHHRQIAKLIYTLAAPDLMVIEHTEVNGELQGQNVGSDLVMAAVEHARANHLKILPQCPFARVVFERHSELNDVVQAHS